MRQIATDNDRLLAESPQNRIAGRIMLRARQACELSQDAFARELSRKMRSPLTQSALSRYEAQARAVPFAVGIAAAQVAREHGVRLGDVIEEELGPATLPQTRRVGRSLEAIGDALEAGQREATGHARMKRASL